MPLISSIEHIYHVRKTKAQMIELMLKQKDVPCTDCGERFPYVCMQFDHVPERGPKVGTVNSLLKEEAAFWLEIAKCDVVCANCHCIRTSSRPWTEERRRKTSDAQKLVQREVQNRLEVRELKAARGRMRGHSEETRARMSRTHMTRVITDEERERRREGARETWRRRKMRDQIL